MAIKLLKAVQDFIGLAGDTKPTGVAPGSRYLAYDTDQTYVTYDGTNWVEYDMHVQLVAGSVSIGAVDTELPAASAINGTILKSVSAPVVGAALLVSDNTNLIQPLGDAANGLDVDVTRLPALAAGTALIGKVGIDQTTDGTTNRVTAKVDKVQGAANMANNQVATSVTAATLVAARATRRSVVIKNMDSLITVYIGVATVTTANGLPLLAGESVSIDWVGLIQVIAASGTPVVAYSETYD